MLRPRRMLVRAACLLVLLAAAACTDGGHASARFANATEGQLRRAADAATWADVDFARAVAGRVWAGNLPGCPRVSTVGLVTMVHTDCTTDTGWTMTGALVVTNLGAADGPAYDPTKPTEVVAHALRATDGERVVSLDGTITLAPAAADDRPRELTVEIDRADSGPLVHTEGTLTCAADGACWFTDAWFGVATLGEAELDPTPFLAGNGHVIARGVDLLRVELAPTATGCHPLRTADPEAELCVRIGGGPWPW